MLVRPGAIGDIIMTLNLIPELKKQNPGHTVHYCCSEGIGKELAAVMKLVGIDSLLPYPSDLSKYTKVINLIGYPVESEGYPHNPMKKHLLDYFAAEMGITNPGTSLCPEIPRIKGLPVKYATLHTKAGWSNYKNWPQDRWESVISSNSQIPFYQIGTAEDPKIPGANHEFMGEPLLIAVSLISNAAIHVGVDSFSNHVTHLTDTPAVILWGSTQASAAGYSKNTNISLGLSCQPCFKEAPELSIHPMGVCSNPEGQTYDTPSHACMSGISISSVTDAVASLWSKVTL